METFPASPETATETEGPVPRCADLLRACADWVWHVDGEGRLTAVAQDLTRLLGRPARSFLGARLADLGVWLSPEAEDLAQTKAFRERRPFRGYELALVDATGKQRVQRLAGAPVFDPRSGAFQGFEGTAQDQSEDRRLAHHMAHHRAQLGHTLECLRQQKGDLRGALESARAADAGKSRFLAQMAHELRTPLNGIIAYAEAVNAGAIPPSRDKYLEIIQDMGAAGRHLLEMIGDVLDLAGLEQGALRVQAEAVPVGPAIAEAFAMVRPAAADKSIETARVATETPAAARAERRRLVQVLVNLLQNAVKYSPAGSEIGVEVRAAAPPDGTPGDEPAAWSGESVDIVVWDTGPGVPPGKREAIFEAFARLQDEESRARIEGLGLGLAVSRQLARAMGGDLWVEDSAQGGAAFVVRLPAANRDASESAPSSA